MRHLLEMHLSVLIMAAISAQFTTNQKQIGLEACECQRSGKTSEDVLFQQLEKHNNKQDKLIDQLTELENKFENIAVTLDAILQHQKKVDETVKNDECGTSLRARSYLDKPRLLGVTPAVGSITGQTVLDGQLFVVLRASQQLAVYNTNNLTPTRNITIHGARKLRAVIASSRYNCLYISDPGLMVVYRYNLYDKVFSNWSVGDVCFGLSLTSTHNVIVTLHYSKQIKEYTPDGSLVRVISLDSSMNSPFHSVQLPNDQFVVCHGWGNSLHRVCIIHASGRIIRCYGGTRGSGSEPVFTPTSLAIDRHDNMLVADRDNNRVALLSSSLTHLGNVTIPGYELRDPRALHLDLLTRRLYIEEDNNTGRVFVLTV